MAEQGLSSEDMRKQATVNAVRRNAGITATPDPMDEAMRIAKQRSAISAMNQIASGGDAEALRSENDRLEAQIARHQLEEKLAEIKRPESAGMNEWQQWLMGQVQDLNGKIGEMQQQQNEAMQAALQERLHLMEAELQRLQTRPPDQNPMVAVKEHIDAAMALVEYMRPPTKEIGPPPPDHTSLELRAWEKRVEIDQERWRAEREDRHQERLAEIAADRQLREQEMAMNTRRSDQVERALSTTLPRIIDLGEQFMSRFMGQNGAAPPPQVAAMTVEAQAERSNGVFVPPGCITGPCQVPGCGYPIVYRKEWATVQCPGCGATYNLTPDDPAPAPAAVTPMSDGGASWEQHGPELEEREEVATPSAGVPFV